MNIWNTKTQVIFVDPGGHSEYFCCDNYNTMISKGPPPELHFDTKLSDNLKVKTTCKQANLLCAFSIIFATMQETLLYFYCYLLIRSYQVQCYKLLNE